MIDTNRLLTRQEVQQKCRLGRSTIYRMMRLGKFPEPLLVGERAVRWRASEIDDFLATRPRANGEVTDRQNAKS